jgi:hypothetical protein
MSTKRSPAVAGGAKQEFQQIRRKSAPNATTDIEFQAVVIAAGDNYNRRYGKPIVSTRLRLIAVLGFRRRRRWRAPFCASVFALERRFLFEFNGPW